jgi:hypothetical protein
MSLMRLAENLSVGQNAKKRSQFTSTYVKLSDENLHFIGQLEEVWGLSRREVIGSCVEMVQELVYDSTLAEPILAVCGLTRRLLEIKRAK